MNAAENEIVPLQHHSLNSIDTFHFTFSNQVNLQFPFAKRSSSSYKQTLQFFPGEKAPVQSGFPLFKLQLLPSGLPSACDLSASLTI